MSDFGQSVDRATPAQTEAQFRRALSLAPHDAALKRNFGIFLGQRGYELRAQGELEAAANALREAVTLAPNLANAWGNLGSVLRMLGHNEEALVALRRSQKTGAAAPEIADAINGSLIDQGKLTEALAGARQLIATRPDHAPAYETLAHLLWEHGSVLAPGEDPLRAIRAAVRMQPSNARLQGTLVRLLLLFKQPQEALRVVGALRQREPDEPVLAWFAADALEALGELEQATPLYERIARQVGAHDAAFVGGFYNAYAQHAFRSKRFDLARELAMRAVQLDTTNQEAWSHLGTAWRLLGDAREHWLHDYEKLVGYVPIETPAGFANLDEFLVALARRLHEIHRAQREPINQSVRGGSQTPGMLFGRDDVLIVAAETALRHVAAQWIGELPDDAKHPFLSRKRASVRFVGSWSVRLQSSGRHANHIHNMGWTSSAFYVFLPRAVREADASSQAGWIQFGAPLESLGLDLLPRRVIQPKPGHLALFPSYTWHGTVPFEDEEPRLTIAFDMQPRT